MLPLIGGVAAFLIAFRICQDPWGRAFFRILAMGFVVVALFPTGFAWPLVALVVIGNSWVAHGQTRALRRWQREEALLREAELQWARHEVDDQIW